MTAKEYGYAAFVLNTNEDEDIERDAIITSFAIPVEFTGITSSKTKLGNEAFRILLDNIQNPGS